MKKKLFALFSVIAVVALIFAGCGNGNNKSSGGAYADEIAPGADIAGDVEVSESSVENRKIIETVSYTVQTKDFDSFVSALQEKISAAGGYTESS